MTAPPALARLPAGVPSFFGAEARLRRAVERRVLDVFAGWSYEEVLLPVFDDAELFSGGLGRARAPRTHRFTDAEGNLLALRPELTTLVARLVATRLRGHRPPLRLAYSGDVFRFDPPRRGASSAVHQLGVEHVGTNRLEADLEVLLVCGEALAALGVGGARLSLGHVGFLAGVVGALGLPPDVAEDLREHLDRRDPDGIARALAGRADAARVDELARLVTLSGGREVLAQARALVRNETSRAALDDLAATLDGAAAAGLEGALAVDLGRVAGYDYYTGLTFQVWAPGLGAPLGGGGRYDRLMAQLGRDLPAVGFSLALDALVRAAEDGPAGPALAAAPTPVALAGDDLAALFRRAAAERRAGRVVRVDAPQPGAP